MILDLNIIDLKTLQGKIRIASESVCPSGVWLKAEIASINFHPSGHCYMELSQSEDGRVVAKVKANIWASHVRFIKSKFFEQTGEELRSGIEILVYVKVNYHTLYGLSLNITDIDPSFTLGAREMKKRKAIERLENEGLMDLQKQRGLRRLPYRLAVVSAEGAAGYGDFRRHLSENEYGFSFSVTLFPATMQGAEAPSSMRSALASVQESRPSYDAILIMRGGGSELDLECYDDYDLCAAIARCRIPVLTAIGHDRDNHVADMVAFDSVKTPTALADYFIELMMEEDSRIGSVESALLGAFSARLDKMERALDTMRSGIDASALGRITSEEMRLEALSSRISPSLVHRMSAMDEELTQISRRITQASAGRVSMEEKEIESLYRRIIPSLSHRTQSMEDALSEYVRRISRSSKEFLRNSSKRQEEAFERVRRAALLRVTSQQQSLLSMENLLSRSIGAILDKAEAKVDYIENSIKISDPRNILLRGVPMVLDGNGVKMESARGVKKGDRIGVLMGNVRLDCTVDGVRVDMDSPAGEGENENKIKTA